jgi:SOS-response transcriptional repressor LexA
MEVDFSSWLRRQIGKRGMLIKQFSEHSGIPLQTINQWMKPQVPNPLPKNIKLLAGALGMEYEQVEKVLSECRASSGATGDPGEMMGGWKTPKIPPVPIFERNLAAGFWTEAVGVSESEVSLLQAEISLFQVRISGDSMEPDYPDGSLVEFRVIRVADDGIEPGGNFYIHRDDDMATFKRVESMTEDAILLRALNVGKYPGLMPVDRARIVRAARATRRLKGLSE